MRLRYKMMAALLATGLGSVALVGGVAYVSVNYKVDSLRRQQAAEHFHTYMTAYFAEYGDWQTAIATESFDRFVRRQEGERPSVGADGRPGGGELPSEMLEHMPPNINDRARMGAPRPAEDGAAPGAPSRAAPGSARITAPAAVAAPVSASGKQLRDPQREPRTEYGPAPEGRGQAGSRPPRGEDGAP
jgi:hypothetical protein